MTCSVCEGLRHDRLRCVGPDDPRFLGLLKKMDHFRGSWRSKKCPYNVNERDLDNSSRCHHCRTLDTGNIHRGRFPELFEEVEKVTDRSISEAVIEDDDKFSERVLHRASSLEENYDYTQDSELAVAAAQLRLAGRYVFDLGNEHSFICCRGCDSFEIRKYRANASTKCKRCKDNLGNSKRYAKREELHKEKWTEANSKTRIIIITHQSQRLPIGV